jgi:hypothetical protein
MPMGHVWFVHKISWKRFFKRKPCPHQIGYLEDPIARMMFFALFFKIRNRNYAQESVQMKRLSFASSFVKFLFQILLKFSCRGFVGSSFFHISWVSSIFLLISWHYQTNSQHKIRENSIIFKNVLKKYFLPFVFVFVYKFWARGNSIEKYKGQDPFCRHFVITNYGF